MLSSIPTFTHTRWVSGSLSLRRNVPWQVVRVIVFVRVNVFARVIVFWAAQGSKMLPVKKHHSA